MNSVGSVTKRSEMTARESSFKVRESKTANKSVEPADQESRDGEVSVLDDHCGSSHKSNDCGPRAGEHIHSVPGLKSNLAVSWYGDRHLLRKVLACLQQQIDRFFQTGDAT